MIRNLFPLLALTIAFGCKSPEQKNTSSLSIGVWRAVIEIQRQQLPFNFEVIHDSISGYKVFIRNAEERLLLDEVSVKNDSVDIALHIFDANIKARIQGDSLVGHFIRNYEKDYKLPFYAVYGQAFRFAKSNQEKSEVDFTGKYQVTFYNEKDTSEAVGIFTQTGDSVTGTFLTPTGDYRYLQGNVINGQLHLSTFDGNHAYIFTATKTQGENVEGKFYSGKSGFENWRGVKNENASIPDAETLTYLKPGYEKMEFSFPDLNGKKISLADDKYKNKVVILQLFGTWCPNCMDETRFLAPWYDANKKRGVEIIGLAYESSDDFNYASERVKKMINKLNVNYDFAIAGNKDKKKAAETLPMLNKIVAFPTTIFVGKDGKVKTIHAGFSGPGTGIYYQQFVEHFNETINELLQENLTSSK